MHFWEAIVLGIVQGLTEFLPVSSSGHLVLGQYFLGMREPLLFFDLMLHIGTLGAVFLVFRRDIWYILLAILGRSRSPGMTKEYGRLLAWLIILGTVPTVIIALFLTTFIEGLFANPLFVSFMLLITGTFLWLSGWLQPFNPRRQNLNFANALIIGIAQGIAALPGISRSGATISTALIRGVPGEDAARFSLLLSIPAIIGASLFELKDIDKIDISISVILVGTLAAFIVGFLAIKFLLRVLRKGRFSRFAYYCWGLGIVGIFGYIIRYIMR